MDSKDILVNMHAEFEAECKKKIERLRNAVNDPASWNAEVQANAQPQPLASPSDPMTYSGGAEPCECKSQMVTAQSTKMDAHLPRPPKNHSLKKPMKKKKKVKRNYRISTHCGGKPEEDEGQNA